MKRATVLLLALTLTTAACSGDGDDGSAAERSPEPSFPIATVLLDNGEASTLLTVDVAETPEQRSSVLGERVSLPRDEGIVFVFFEPSDEGFATERTSLSLSVAFFDARGTIVRILDVEPCTVEPCRVPDPGAGYMGALVVDRGAFEEWDISEGDHVQLTR